MKILIIILAGIFIALVKTIIEYKWYDKVKNEKIFHAVGLTVEFILFGIIFFSTRDIKLTIISILFFWNIFEFGSNLAHKQKLLYVGYNASLDKFLRKVSKHVEVLQFIIHLITLTIVFLLIL